MLKCWNHSITPRYYAVTFFKNVEEVPWHKGLLKIKNVKNFKKLKKMCKIVNICVFLANGWL